jgi:hypothetical protein
MKLNLKKIEDQESTKQNKECAAYGCGLPGSLSSGTNGESRFYCRFHFGTPTQKNDQITFKIHQNEKLRNIYDMCIKPEQFFKGDNKVTFFEVAEEHISKELFDMGLHELLASKNLLKTAKSIMREMEKRFLS